jgi:hypothetical protein
MDNYMLGWLIFIIIAVIDVVLGVNLLWIRYVCRGFTSHEWEPKETSCTQGYHFGTDNYSTNTLMVTYKYKCKKCGMVIESSKDLWKPPAKTNNQITNSKFVWKG